MSMNLILSSELYSHLSPARMLQLVDISPLENFALDYETELSALGASGHPLTNAISANPTVISASFVRWGDATNGIDLTGNGFGPVSSIEQLENALLNGFASGAFTGATIRVDGQTIMSISLTATSIALTTGNQQIALTGAMPTGVQELFDLITNTSALSDISLLAPAELTALIDEMRAYDINSFSLSENGSQLLAISLGEAALSLTAGGATLRLDGTFPTQNLGTVLDMFRAFNDASEAGTPITNLDDYAALAIDGLTLIGADGTLLIGSSGSIDDLNGPPFADVMVQGTGGNDSIADFLVYDDTANQLLADLGAGDDTARVNIADLINYNFDYRSDTLSNTYLEGGSGDTDTLHLIDPWGYSNHYFAGALPVIDLDTGLLSLWTNDYYYTAHTLGLGGFERIISETEDLQVLGGAADETIVYHWANNTLYFQGGAGTDTLDMSQVDRGDGSMGLTHAEFTSNFGLGFNSAGPLLFGNDVLPGLPSYITLSDVEQIIFRTATGTETLDLADVLTEIAPGFLLGTSGDDVISGNSDEGSILMGQSGVDYLFGDGLPVASVPDLSSQVFRLYQATLGRDPDATGHQNWTRMLLSGETDIRTAASGFVNAREFTNTYGALDNHEFVALMYTNVLGREASEGEVQNWVNLMTRANNPLDKAQVALGFSDSREFINETAADAAAFAAAVTPTAGNDAQIFRLYHAALDRDPDVGGFGNWLDALANGTSLQSAANGFASAREFSNTYGTLSDVEFIERMYLNVLDRPSDQAGMNGWLNAIDNGATKADVLLGFANAREFINATAPLLTQWMLEQGTDDTLYGGDGDNVLAGGLWSDSFVFGYNNTGSNTVLDLEPWDTLDFSDLGYFSPEDLRNDMTEVGNDVVFDNGTLEVTLLNTTLDQITDEMLHSSYAG